MSNDFLIPGDKDPTDHAQPGDQAKLDAGGGPHFRAGDRAPGPGASKEEQERYARQMREEAAPLNQRGMSLEPDDGKHDGGDDGAFSALQGLNFSAPFIQRPVATFLLSIALLIAGAAAYRLLPVSSLPQVEFPTISVNASLPGADPDTMASSVATPLERQFSRIAGVTQMTSSSSTGACGVVLQFDLNRDINGAARDVQAAINAARAQLPANLPANPTYRKINPSDSPILILALTSDTVSVPVMYDVSDSILAQRIAQVPGVGQTFTGGSAKPAVRIELNPNQLTAQNLGLENVRSIISTVNVLQPTGYLNGAGPNSTRTEVSASDQLFGAAAYKDLIIATNQGPVSNAQAATGLPASVASAVTGGAGASASGTISIAAPQNTTFSAGSSSPTPTSTTASSTGTNFATSTISTFGPANEHGIVRLKDVANVIDSVEDVHTGGYINEKPAIQIVVFKSPGANVIDTVDAVMKLLPTLQASIPPAIKLSVVLDRTLTIRASVEDVTRTLIISIGLVILVVYLFLREGRSTIIPSVSVPLSLLGTFGVMYLLDYTLDNLSLMALTISTGFVVDDAIVVIENISRHLEEGLPPYQAAMRGAQEIGFTVISMSISLVAVFIPILLMGGIVGRLFREFAVTLSVAIAVSLVVSLTTTPMLAAKFLKPHNDAKKGWFWRTGEKHLARLTGEYERGLNWVLDHQGITLLVFIATFALNIYLFLIVPKGFFPQQDTGRLSGQIRGQQDTSFLTMKTRMLDVMKIISKDPGIESAATFLGGGGPGGGSSNQAQMNVVLKPDAERQKTGDTAEVIINRLRPKLSVFPGLQVFLQSSQELNIGGRSSAAQYQYTLTADTVDQLREWAPQVQMAMARLPELRDVNTDAQDHGLESYLVIDRDTASRLGVSALAIDTVLSDAFGQRQVSTTYKPLNQYHVVMEVAQEYQNDPTDMQKIYVKSASGSQVPLAAVTHIENRRIPLSVNHQSLSPATTVSYNLAPGVSLSDATLAIENARQQLGVPSTVHGGFQGSAQAFQASLSSEPYLILLALVTVYIVLGILYESYIHPITILSTLPSAGVGAILALLIFHIDLSVIAIIGIILLIGIVKKNAIMMIDFALVAEREHGKTPKEAIHEACLLRFRPIMMTTMAALLGGIPLALGRGTGSELRQPLGVTIVGGLIVSQCLTLFTTPVIYLFFDKLRDVLPQFRRKSRQARETGHVHGGPEPLPAAGD